MLLNEVYTVFNYLIRGQEPNRDLTRKMEAFNLGSSYLLDRLVEKGKPPRELLSLPTNFDTFDGQNYVELASDDLRPFHVWFKNSANQYQLFPRDSMISWDELVRRLGPDLFIDTNVGDPTMLAPRANRLYFDQYFSVDETDRIKIESYHLPALLESYDQLNISGIVGTFQVGETITGTDSSAIGVIRSINLIDGYILMNTATRSGTFVDGEIITGDTSAATATVVGVLIEKSQILEWTQKYKLILATSAAAAYLKLLSSLEALEKLNDLDVLIEQHTATTFTGKIRMSISATY